MKTLAILGAGGHGKVIADTASAAGWEKIIFFDMDWPNFRPVRHWSICGNFDDLLAQLPFIDGVIIGIGDNQIRYEKACLLNQVNAPFVTIIHPRAMISPFVKIGLGTVVMAGAIINIDAQVGHHCIINSGAILEHDVKIADYVHISPNASLAGGVIVDSFSWVGLGVTVRQKIHIGTRVILGAGSVLVQNTPNHCTMIGVPAKIK